MNLIPRKYYLDDVFDNFFKQSNTMKCDIYEEDGIYSIEIDIPGFNKDDIEIDVNNGYLNIKATKNEENNDRNYIRKERIYNEYERSFYLGNLNEEEIKANFKDGILKITIPKLEEKETKKTIDIE